MSDADAKIVIVVNLCTNIVLPDVPRLGVIEVILTLGGVVSPGGGGGMACVVAETAPDCADGFPAVS